MPSSAFTIVSVFPEVLGTYGDSGNALVLQRRLEWRGLPVRTVVVSAGQVLPLEGDLYVIGGSEDDAQAFAVDRLRAGSLAQAVTRGAHVFGVCAGLQLLGETFATGAGDVVAGLGLLDLRTTRLAHRVVGEVVAELATPTGADTHLTGFANHGGGSELGRDASPLGTVCRGQGNRGAVGDPEGAVQGRVVATYLHGPVLARNPAFADWLLERAGGAALPPLQHGPAERLHAHLTTDA